MWKIVDTRAVITSNTLTAVVRCLAWLHGRYIAAGLHFAHKALPSLRAKNYHVKSDLSRGLQAASKIF